MTEFGDSPQQSAEKSGLWKILNRRKFNSIFGVNPGEPNAQTAVVQKIDHLATLAVSDRLVKAPGGQNIAGSALKKYVNASKLAQGYGFSISTPTGQSEKE